jgi:hypothetical protein
MRLKLFPLAVSSDRPDSIFFTPFWRAFALRANGAYSIVASIVMALLTVRPKITSFRPKYV